MTGNEGFLQYVSSEFLKVFVNIIMYSDSPHLKHNGLFVIHEWGTKHLYVNGEVSEFYNTWEKLKKSRVKVPETYIEPSNLGKKSVYKRSPNKNPAYIDQTKDMVVNMCKTMNKWSDDKKLYDELKAEISQRKKRLGEMSLSGNKEADELEKIMKSLPAIMSRIQNNDVKAKLNLIEISKGFTSPVNNSSVHSEESLRKTSNSTKKAASPEVSSSLKRSIKNTDRESNVLVINTSRGDNAR
jgi:hypothetical protein